MLCFNSDNEEGKFLIPLRYNFCYLYYLWYHFCHREHSFGKSKAEHNKIISFQCQAQDCTLIQRICDIHFKQGLVYKLRHTKDAFFLSWSVND